MTDTREKRSVADTKTRPPQGPGSIGEHPNTVNTRLGSSEFVLQRSPGPLY